MGPSLRANCCGGMSCIATFIDLWWMSVKLFPYCQFRFVGFISFSVLAFWWAFVWGSICECIWMHWRGQASLPDENAWGSWDLAIRRAWYQDSISLISYMKSSALWSAEYKQMQIEKKAPEGVLHSLSALAYFSFELNYAYSFGCAWHPAWLRGMSWVTALRILHIPRQSPACWDIADWLRCNTVQNRRPAANIGALVIWRRRYSRQAWLPGSVSVFVCLYKFCIYLHICAQCGSVHLRSESHDCSGNGQNVGDQDAWPLIADSVQGADRNIIMCVLRTYRSSDMCGKQVCHCHKGHPYSIQNCQPCVLQK